MELWKTWLKSLAGSHRCHYWYNQTISDEVAGYTDVHSLEHILLTLFDRQQLRRRCVQYSQVYTDPQENDHNKQVCLPVGIPVQLSALVHKLNQDRIM